MILNHLGEWGAVYNTFYVNFAVKMEKRTKSQMFLPSKNESLLFCHCKYYGLNISSFYVCVIID